MEQEVYKKDHRSLISFIWIMIIMVGVVVGVTKATAMSDEEFETMVKNNHLIIKDNMDEIVSNLKADGYHCNYGTSFGGYAECYVNVNDDVKVFSCTAKVCAMED